MVVSRVHVAGFRRLEDVTVEVEPVNVLVGGNNSGKSSLLQALHFANVLCQKTPFGPESEGVVSGSLAESDLRWCPVATIEAFSYQRSMLKGGTLVIELADEQGEKATLTVTKGDDRSLWVQAQPGPFLERLREAHSPFAIYVPGLAGLPPSESLKPSGEVAAAVARGDANLVLRNVLRQLKEEQPQEWPAFQGLLNGVFPEVTLKPPFYDQQDETIRVLADVAGEGIPLEACGTGILQAVQILSYATYYCPGLLLLDEPDAHLHPQNQRVIADLLSRLAHERKIRVVLATHSRHLFYALRHDAQIIWMKDGGAERSEEVDSVGMLLDLGALDEGDKLRDGRYDCLFLTEDGNPRILKTLLAANGFQMSRTLVWPYGSSTQLNAARALAHFVREFASGTRLAVHRDRDYLTPAEVADESARFRRAHIEFFITKGVDIESHLLDAACLAACNPMRSPNEWQAALDAVTEEARDTSIRKFVRSQRFAKRKAQRDEADAALYAQCVADYESNPARYRHGKTVLSALRSRHQKETGQNLVLKASPHLGYPKLKEIAASIWPAGKHT